MAQQPLRVTPPQPILPPAAAQQVVSSTNRPTTARGVLGYAQTDGVINALENAPNSKRGDRRRPTIMKFPTEIGTGQFPHVMQFKVFWRWEAKELRDAKAEGEKTLETLSTLKDLIDNGSFNPVGLQASNIDQQTSMALQEVLYNDKLLKTVNPSIDQNLATLLQNDPAGARDLMEKTVESYQYRVSTLATEIDEGGKGAVTLDEDERMQVNSRVGQVLADTSATEAGLKAGALAGASQFAASYLSGKDWKRSAIDAAKTGAGAGAAVAGAILAAQALQNEPKYDQMVSIYLPMCTKIGNEDTFVYEDASGAAVAGILGALNETTDSIAQGTVAATIYAANKVGQGGAFGAISGLVLNPRLEKVFKAKDFRTFNFTWEMYPRTPDEAQQIRDIIETFRYHANPSYDEELIGTEGSQAKIILRAPAEFTVRFLSTDPTSGGFVENEFIPKVARLACTSVSMDYTTNGVFTTFKDNSPTSVSFTLAFQEIETLTREAVDKGY